MFSLAKNTREYERETRKKKPKIDTEDHQTKYVKIMCELKSEGYIDKRKPDKICKQCKKQCIKYEEIGHVLGPNEVFMSHTIKNININWRSQCLKCQALTNKKFKTTNPDGYISRHLRKLLKRHINGTKYARKYAYTIIRQRSRNWCDCCGITVIFCSGSGWRQASITDKYPNLRSTENPVAPIEDLVIVCLACQWFQHDLSWEDHLKAIKTIATCDLNAKNTTPLTVIERRWVSQSGYAEHVCPNDIRIKVVERDGRHCRETNAELVFEPGHWNTASFDRDNSSLWYTFDQTRLVCKSINYVKTKAITKSEMEKWLAHLRIMYDRSKREAYTDTFLHALFEN
jgi:hypothetical protein